MKKALCLVLVGFMFLSGCQRDKNLLDESVLSETVTITEDESLQAIATTTTQQTTTSDTTATTTETTQTIGTTTQTTQQQTSATTQATTKPTETTTKKEEESEMPEIVFITLANSYESENVVYGYFINNKGEIRYFEFFDEKGLKAAKKKNSEGYSGWSYTTNFIEIDFSANLLKEMYNTIIEVSVDTGDRVDMGKLTEMYNQLLTVEPDYEIEADDYSLDIDYMIEHTYGIKNNLDSENEIILLRGGGEVLFWNNDVKANSLLKEVDSILPDFKLYYVPKLLQEDN